MAWKSKEVGGYLYSSRCVGVRVGVMTLVDILGDPLLHVCIDSKRNPRKGNWIVGLHTSGNLLIA